MKNKIIVFKTGKFHDFPEPYGTEDIVVRHNDFTTCVDSCISPGLYANPYETIFVILRDGRMIPLCHEYDTMVAETNWKLSKIFQTATNIHIEHRWLWARDWIENAILREIQNAAKRITPLTADKLLDPLWPDGGGSGNMMTELEIKTANILKTIYGSQMGFSQDRLHLVILFEMLAKSQERHSYFSTVINPSTGYPAFFAKDVEGNIKQEDESLVFINIKVKSKA